MALNSLYCADVPLSNYSLTHSLAASGISCAVFLLRQTIVNACCVDVQSLEKHFFTDFHCKIFSDIAVFASVSMQPDLENPRSTSAFPCDRERQALITMETLGYFGPPTGPVSEMTYTVSSGTLNPSIPYHTSNRTLKLHEVVPVFLNSYTVIDVHFSFFLF